MCAASLPASVISRRRRTDRARTDRSRAALTLVEMLTVMGIIALILAAAGPVVIGVLGARGINNSIDAISGYLTNARNVAISQNTYVVVGFYQAPAGGAGNPDDLQMAAVVPLNGTFTPANFPSSPSSTQAATYRQLTPIVHLPNVTLTQFANLAPALKTNLTNANAAPNPASQSGGDPSTIIVPDTPANPSSPSSGVMAFLYGGTAFNWYLIVFTPQGEALYFPSGAAAVTSNTPYYSQLFIGLSTSRAGAALANDLKAAGITIDGGSGGVNVYRL